ncbi:hypothetical protein C8Q76DRAFT_789514 [Earliella scabrosa]|nr:hypothetical protein C8Q76DRAFT_789514 [Earliella scabrosa]
MIEPTIHNTLGSALIGNILAACLFGVTTQQTITYFRRFRDDPKGLKLLVGVLWFADIMHVVLLS